MSSKRKAFHLSIFLTIETGQVTAGSSFLMDGAAAAYIGFSVFGAGKPNVIGTLFGSILMGVLLNGLTMMNVPYYVGDIIKGAILVGALALSHIQKNRNVSFMLIKN
jgi:simple sugar transport system permease protein